jgi:hypothetical protein
MKSPQLLTLFVLGTTHVHAAVSILVEPNSSGHAVFTVTETAPNPLLNIAGTSGYALGMELPTSMFNIPGFGPGMSSDIEGDLTPPIATITEVYSNQSFFFKHLRISVGPGPSILSFDSLFVTGIGATSARFEVSSLGPVVTPISFGALNLGVHTTGSTTFDTVTVTVVPESSAALLLAVTTIPIFSRRRRIHTTQVPQAASLG